MNATTPLQIKADRDGFLLVPDPMSPFSTITDELQKKLSEAGSFFKQSKMILDLRRRPFRTGEVNAIRDLLEQSAGIRLAEVRIGDNLHALLRWASQALGVEIKAEVSDAKIDSGSEQRAQVQIIRTTCRSGTHIESPADCVVLGDVNPGAEILAVGDIIVFGSLRGVAHAGFLGDRSAKIMALSIEPNQIRIADLVALPPQGCKPVPKRFEMAEIRGDQIEVITL